MTTYVRNCRNSDVNLYLTSVPFKDNRQVRLFVVLRVSDAQAHAHVPAGPSCCSNIIQEVSIADSFEVPSTDYFAYVTTVLVVRQEIMRVVTYIRCPVLVLLYAIHNHEFVTQVCT